MSEVLPYEIFEKFFAPFSGHMLEYKGVVYPTVEHAYHCQRYEDREVIEKIMAARSAYQAWEVSQGYKKEQKEGWDELKVSVMEELFHAKVAQHEDVRNALIRSGDQIIVKHQEDAFWGDGKNGTGRNEMGKIWMKIRNDIREE